MAMELSSSLLAVDKPQGQTAELSCSHCVRLGDALGSGTSAVVFAVNSVEPREASSQRTFGSSSSLVAKVSKTGPGGIETTGARAEAAILSSLKPHANVVGFHGLFCSCEANEALEAILGTFAKKKRPAQLAQTSRVPSNSSSQAPTATSSGRPESLSLVNPLRSQSEEIAAFSDLNEPDLPRLRLFTLQERCDRSLKDLLAAHSLSEEELAFTMSNIFKGLAHLHQSHVFHRDITDGNLLVADRGRRVVICDFDLSVQTQGYTEVAWRCGTPGFVAPEVLMKRRGTDRSDIFSVGVVAFFAACGTHAFVRDGYKATGQATIHEEPDFWGGHVLQRSHDCLSFIDSMLCKQALLRPTAAECLCSPWLEASPCQDLTMAIARPRRKSTHSYVTENGEVTKAQADAGAESAEQPGGSKSLWKRLSKPFPMPSIIRMKRLFTRKRPAPQLAERRLAQVVPA